MKILYDDIVNQIKESQIKLGYVPESVQLFYKKDGLESRLGRPVGSLRETAAMLAASDLFANSPLGTVEFAPSKGRLCVTVSPEGARYVHENVPASDFLVALIGLFGCGAHPGRDEVLELFAQFGSYQLADAPAGADFDYRVSFDDPSVDPHVYCFKQEGSLLTYHRLTQEDYISRTAN